MADSSPTLRPSVLYILWFLAPVYVKWRGGPWISSVGVGGLKPPDYVLKPGGPVKPFEAAQAC